MPNGMEAPIADVENVSYASFSDALVRCISGMRGSLWYSGCYEIVEAGLYTAILYSISGRYDAGWV